MPQPRCAAADGEGARGTGPQPMGKGQRGQAAPGRGSGRERNGLSPSGGKARRGGRGALGAVAGGTLGSAQHRQGAGRAWAAQAPALPNCPGQQRTQPCRGAKQEGARGSPAEQGLCEGVPAHTGGLSLRHKARRGPAPCSLVQGGSCPHCRQPQPRWEGQAAGKQAAEAEAWPLLLLKGTGEGGQALRRWWGAGTQRAEPGTRAEARQVPRAAGAGGCRAVG